MIAGCALALAAAVVLLAPQTSHAQVRWGVGMGGRGSSGVYFGNAPSWGYGYAPYSNFGYGYGYNPWSSYGYSPWSGYGSSWDSGYAPYYSRRGNRWSSPSYSFGYSPSYYSGYTYPSGGYTYSQPGMTYSYPSSGYTSSGFQNITPSSGYTSTYPIETTSGQTFYGATTSVQSDRSAHVEVQVPANAEIWFEGQKTNQTGTVRHFTSPPLEPGQQYTYEIRAKWMENGQEVNRTKRQSVQAGSNVSVNFSSADHSHDATPSDRVRPADTTTDRFDRGTTPTDRFSPDRGIAPDRTTTPDRPTTPDRGIAPDTTTPRDTIKPPANPPGSDKPN
jgi:uncharacterized protein (TIGR03000 family)